MDQGAIHLMANPQKLIVVILLSLLTGCSEFALLASGASIAGTQNAYVKAYNAVDFGVVITTEKGIKQHAYEKGKKYIVDHAKTKTLGILKNH